LNLDLEHTGGRIGLPSGNAGPPEESQGPGNDRATTGDPSSILSDVVDELEVRRIKDLPKEVGVMLVSVGVVGFVMPGMAGAPAIVAGGLVLWPSAFGKLEDWFQRRYPGMHQRGMQQISRYLDDLERRFPDLSKREPRAPDRRDNT
jgi:hypothetical protein